MPVGWSITQIWVKPSGIPPDLSEPSNLSDHPELRESRSDHPELSTSPIFEGGHLPRKHEKLAWKYFYIWFPRFPII